MVNLVDNPHPSEPPIGLLETEGPIFDNPDDLFDRSKVEGAVARAVQKLKVKIPAIWSQLNEAIQVLIGKLSRETGVGRDQVAAEWLVQGLLFHKIAEHFHLKKVIEFGKEQDACFMILTENGSLLSGGLPGNDRNRDVEYFRIPSRKAGWPDKLSYRTALVENIQLGNSAILYALQTSAVRGIIEIPKIRAGELAKIEEHTKTAVGCTILGGSASK